MNRAVVRFFAIASLASAPLCADTVLWYRLDGFASGVKTDGTTLIDNIASPGNNQLVCYSWTTIRSAKGALLLTPSECAFTIGANQNFSGYVDELRFTDGVLPVSAFMRAMPKGMVLTVR